MKYDYSKSSTERLMQMMKCAQQLPDGARIALTSELLHRQQQQIDDLVTKVDLVAQGVGKSNHGGDIKCQN